MAKKSASAKNKSSLSTKVALVISVLALSATIGYIVYDVTSSSDFQCDVAGIDAQNHLFYLICK